MTYRTKSVHSFRKLAPFPPSPREMTAAYILLQGSVAPNSERAGRSLPKDEALKSDLGPGTVEDHMRSFAADVA